MHLDFFIKKQKAEAGLLPEGDRSITAWCGKLLSGASVAAIEVYHHGYLIPHTLLRDQQGQFYALSTVASLCDEQRSHPMAGRIPQHVNCEDEPERDGQR